MTTTEKFGLAKPDQDDLYNIGVYNANLEIIDAQVPKGVGVTAIVALTELEYDALETKDPATVYIVT